MIMMYIFKTRAIVGPFLTLEEVHDCAVAAGLDRNEYQVSDLITPHGRLHAERYHLIFQSELSEGSCRVLRDLHLFHDGRKVTVLSHPLLVTAKLGHEELEIWLLPKSKQSGGGSFADVSV